MKNIIDLLFIIVCIVLVFTMTAYIIYVEKAKLNAEDKCIHYKERYCTCEEFKFVEDELENNS